MFEDTTGGARIELSELTKQYDGQPHPAVDHVTMDIPAGELVMFLGPSGCGKTTTMKMVNRLIEPTSGSIRIGGEDVLQLQPNQLRRRVGYVIQQIGLFPHMTIADNVGIVPKLLGWNKQKTAERVDELLELVGLQAGSFRSRYPRQLSGGQQQRVGVARALAANPPVMLMDEPFGATDPITREHLQSEFKRLQEEIRKTVIFVTHDFEEAVKLGDRIAVLRDRSTIAQYDTPERILAAPADDYVASFIGSNPTLKRLGLALVSEVPTRALPTAEAEADATRLRQAASTDPAGVVIVLDPDSRPLRVVTPNGTVGVGSEGASRTAPTVASSATLREALDQLVAADAPCVVVTGPDGRYVGGLFFDDIRRLADRRVEVSDGPD